ncbi:MAG: hypothetical protein H6587_04580 [Flavobacteriales bacterium]|nr:hypothetical protein [Flavobacteriales bacterium]
MKKKVIKYSKVSPAMRKLIRQTLEDEDVKFFDFPYQGSMEEGFLMEGEEDGEPVNFLVIVDDEKKSTYKPVDDDDDEDEDDFDDDIDEVNDVEDEDAISDDDDDEDYGDGDDDDEDDEN